MGFHTVLFSITAYPHRPSAEISLFKFSCGLRAKHSIIKKNCPRGIWVNPFECACRRRVSQFYQKER
ncbi:MAG TPA: hypothetical protein DF364_04275 [Ruminococcaceae bacterium]|nr:hypothetical protein [Oscillospiraceae bacterium]HCU33047.1 hypothetical protein [Oscillospiraceae bacterium]